MFDILLTCYMFTFHGLWEESEHMQALNLEVCNSGIQIYEECVLHMFQVFG